MRLQRCPHCGAENSAKRTTCFSCEKQLASGHVTARSEDRPAAPSRWQALEPAKRKPAPRPLEDSVAKPLEPRGALEGAAPEAGGRPAAAPAPRPVPIARSHSSMRHIRRMGMFYRGLHTLLKAGINLSTACNDLELRAPAGFRGLAREMAAAVSAGRPISSVLERHRNLIYPWHLGVVRAAEAAGSLPQALDQIATAYETEWQTRSQVALQYFVYGYLGIPVLLLTIPVIMMMQHPFPKEGWSNALTLQLLLHNLMTVSLPAGGGLLGLMLAWRILSTFYWVQAFQQHVVLRLPVFGRLSRMVAAERYLSTLGMLLQAGVPLTDSANEAALAAGNPALTPRLLQVAPQVQAGVPLVKALADARLFDPDTLRLAGTGEVTGTLPDMLNRAGAFLRDQHVARRRMLIRTAGVLATVVFAVIVAMVFYWGMTSYVTFLLRFGQWMEE